MSGNGNDRDLERWFESAREADRGEAPAFDRTWREARRRAARSSRRTGLRLALGAALTTAAVAAGVLLLGDHRGRSLSFSDEEIAMARAISAWTAPSDAIASISGVHLSVEIPRLEIESVRLPTMTPPRASESGGSASPSRAVP
jgi:hypothetical protein